MMKNEEIFPHIDHTLLKQVSTWEGIVKLCDQAVQYRTASVCIPPCYIKRVHQKYGDSLKICTVIGFPNGYNTTAVKVFEAEQAILDGADEIDMVINITDVKNGDYTAVEEEIRALRNACKGKILKVIVETCFLTEEEKVAMCMAVTNAGADYIKTSTGFGGAGATREDIRLFKEHIGSKVKMKAAGGVKTKEDIEDFLALGCDRIGTSSAIDLLTK